MRGNSNGSGLPHEEPLALLVPLVCSISPLKTRTSDISQGTHTHASIRLVSSRLFSAEQHGLPLVTLAQRSRSGTAYTQQWTRRRLWNRKSSLSSRSRFPFPLHRRSPSRAESPPYELSRAIIRLPTSLFHDSLICITTTTVPSFSPPLHTLLLLLTPPLSCARAMARQPPPLTAALSSHLDVSKSLSL